MLPPKAPSAAGSPEERRLARLYRSLEPADRRTLVAFAEFLAQGRRPDATPEPVQEPNLVPRPDEETVIAAIRRLSLSYSMLEREPMLHETSALMSAHVLRGRGAAEVIDQLEALFERHYQGYRARLGGSDAAGGPAAKQDL
jgi:hypothetical protein